MMTASVPSTIRVFWCVYRNLVEDQTTLTPCDLKYEYAPEFSLFSYWSRITSTRTPRLAAAARSCSAVVSANSYMVTSTLCLAPLMSLYTGEKLAPGSMIRGPDRVIAVVPDCAATALGRWRPRRHRSRL